MIQEFFFAAWPLVACGLMVAFVCFDEKFTAKVHHFQTRCKQNRQTSAFCKQTYSPFSFYLFTAAERLLFPSSNFRQSLATVPWFPVAYALQLHACQKERYVSTTSLPPSLSMHYTSSHCSLAIQPCRLMHVSTTLEGYPR